MLKMLNKDGERTKVHIDHWAKPEKHLKSEQVKQTQSGVFMDPPINQF